MYKELKESLNLMDSDYKKTRRKRRLVKGLYRIATGLLVLIFVSAITYFIGFPLLPELKEFRMRLDSLSPYNVGYMSAIQLYVRMTPPSYDFLAEEDSSSDLDQDHMEYISESDDVKTSDLEKKETYLRINSASIAGNVVDGLSQDSMLRGFWHFPLSSAPGERGNVVIFGHRFDKLPPSTETFYYLDNVKVGDKIEITQSDQYYTYTVVETDIVEKNDSTILKNTGDYRLTLITCTPLWTSEKRLVVVAVQDRISTVI